MNIAFVNATSGWGGVKTWYLQFAEELLRCGHTIRVYGRQLSFVEKARERVGHGVLMRFGPDLSPSTIRFFYHEFQKQGTDVVIVNVGKDLATAGVAATLLKIPVVQRIGLPNDIALRLKTRLLHRWIRPVFLCPCQFIADGFLKSLPYVDPGDVKVILNGKKLDPMPIQNHQPRQLICTQQLSDDKGHEVLLHALAGLQTLEWTLHIWGTGRSEDQLKALSKELGLSERVLWHGFSLNITEALRQADIFLLASLSEGLPNTLLEAMAAGLLPVTRDVGGVCEVIPDTLKPWMLPYKAKAEAFRERIRAALALPDEELRILREQAKQACKEQFHLETQAALLGEWLQGLCSRRSR